MTTVLKLKRGEDRRIRAGHPWVFSNEIDNTATPLAKTPPGSVVRIHSDRDQFLGHAYANPHALICARIVGRDVEQPLDRSLLIHRINVALALRERLTREPYSPAGLRRVRRAARPGSRPVRRRGGRADRDPGYGRVSPGRRRGGSLGPQASRHVLEERLQRARPRTASGRRGGRVRRGAGRSRSDRGGSALRRAARDRSENRLVL